VVPAPAIDPRQAQEVAHPDVVLAVRIHGTDFRLQKAPRIVCLVSIAAERQSLSSKVVQPARSRADPDVAFAVFENRAELVVTDAVRLEWRVAIADRAPPVRIDPDQAATVRRQPQV